MRFYFVRKQQQLLKNFFIYTVQYAMIVAIANKLSDLVTRGQTQ